MNVIKDLLNAAEDETTEFKEAKNSFEFDELVKYVCAIANEGGGRVVLGVTDRRPREVVGTKAFDQPERTRAGILERLGIGVSFQIHEYEGKRVLVFVVPARPLGTALQYKGVYWGRSGDRLLPLNEEKLRLIFAESGRDFSAEICSGATVRDLDPDAIEEFRRRWMAKSGNQALTRRDPTQLLEDCEAVVDGGVTYAALILFGTRAALGKLLGQAELVFEYRSSDASGAAQQRNEYRHGFFNWYEQLWSSIATRNDIQHFRSGLFVMDVPTFDEQSVREAVLNAVSHRDYQLGGSIFIRQYPRRITIDSPGGFPHGITTENLLDRQSPRNRRIADIFSRCGLVERSGQGMNLMFEASIRSGKHLPNFAGTDATHVKLTLDGQIQDPGVLQMMEEIGEETLATFSTEDFLVVNQVYREQAVRIELRERLPRLIDLGIVEKAARGKYILGRRYYHRAGRIGAYTRRQGLDRETKKELLLKHIRKNAESGCKLKELCEVLPAEKRSQVQLFLRELRNSGKVHSVGATNAARWYPGDV
jgi:ATP-dependent DNA helicase RecG